MSKPIDTDLNDNDFYRAAGDMLRDVLIQVFERGGSVAAHTAIVTAAAGVGVRYALLPTFLHHTEYLIQAYTRGGLSALAGAWEDVASGLQEDYRHRDLRFRQAGLLKAGETFDSYSRDSMRYDECDAAVESLLDAASRVNPEADVTDTLVVPVNPIEA